MEDDVCCVHQFRQKLAILDGLDKVLHSIMLLEVANVIHAAGGKIVEQQNFIAGLQHPFGKV
jgi:hypothetical protein